MVEREARASEREGREREREGEREGERETLRNPVEKNKWFEFERERGSQLHAKTLGAAICDFFKNN